MWNANINKTSVENEQFVVYVTYSNDASGETKPEKIIPFSINENSSSEISAKIQSDLDALNAIETLSSQVTLGPFVPPEPPPPPPPPPPPTDDQKRRMAYQMAIAARQNVLQAIAIGAISSNDPLVATSATIVEEGFSLYRSQLEAQLDDATEAIESAPQ